MGGNSRARARAHTRENTEILTEREREIQSVQRENIPNEYVHRGCVLDTEQRLDSHRLTEGAAHTKPMRMDGLAR